MSDEFPEKMDALDLIINALKDHEKRLDAISRQLKEIFDVALDRSVVEERRVQPPVQRIPVEPTRGTPAILICANWADFKQQFKGQKGRIVAFEVKDAFTVSTLINDVVLRYVEALPSQRVTISEDATHFLLDKTGVQDVKLLELIINRRLQCGLTLAITAETVVRDQQLILELNYKLPSNTVKRFLVTELDTVTENVVEGQLTY